jgi:hypothetical protein
MDDFRVSYEDLLLSLDAIFRIAEVGYAVVGAYAVAAWGEVQKAAAERRRLLRTA